MSAERSCAGRHLLDHHRDIARRTEQNGLDDVLEHLGAEVRFLALPAAACQPRGTRIVIVAAVPQLPHVTVERAAAPSAECHTEQE